MRNIQIKRGILIFLVCLLTMYSCKKEEVNKLKGKNISQILINGKISSKYHFSNNIIEKIERYEGGELSYTINYIRNANNRIDSIFYSHKEKYRRDFYEIFEYNSDQEVRKSTIVSLSGLFSEYSEYEYFEDSILKYTYDYTASQVSESIFYYDDAMDIISTRVYVFDKKTKDKNLYIERFYEYDEMCNPLYNVPSDIALKFCNRNNEIEVKEIFYTEDTIVSTKNYEYIYNTEGFPISGNIIELHDSSRINFYYN